MKRLRSSRRIICISILLILILSSNNISLGESPFKLEAKSAILVDATTGEIIFEKNIHEKLPPASITKIMLLLIAMEELDSGKISLEDKVAVSSYAAGMGGSQVYLEEGEIQTVDNLLKAISLRSANDAAVALAEHISGSIEVFVKRMNDRAKELGMKNTNFKNATGLPDEGHYTTAYDISLMSRELLKHERIHEWLTVYMTDIYVGKKKDVVQTLVNTNKLIRDYQGANGLKTGLTNDAGYCLAASAKRGNLSLVSVLLGGPSSESRFKESKLLLDYGFANYDSYPICKENEIVQRIKIFKGKETEIKVVAEKDYSVLVKKGAGNEIEKEIQLPESIEAPCEKGQKIGEIIIKNNNNEIGRVNLVAGDTVKKASLLDMIKRITSIFLGGVK